MKTTYYDSENLRKARALHDEALRLHLAPPPIVTWGAKIFEPSGEQIEEILAKSNSYTRNALNLIACMGGLVARNTNAAGGVIGGGFEDGKLGAKTTGGTVRSTPQYFSQGDNSAIATSGESNFTFYAGYSDSAETIDSYVLGNVFGDGSGENQLNKGTSTKSSVWDSANRKFVTTVARQFTNGYGSSQIIKEIGLMQKLYINTSVGPEDFLVLRDVLASPITLTSGQTVILYYQLEASIPSS